MVKNPKGSITLRASTEKAQGCTQLNKFAWKNINLIFTLSVLIQRIDKTNQSLLFFSYEPFLSHCSLIISKLCNCIQRKADGRRDEQSSAVYFAVYLKMLL